MAFGGDAYAEHGVNRSKGTLAFQLSGNVKQGGLVELAFGVTLREIIDKWGGGTASGKPVYAVQVGGPLGAYFPESLLDTPLDYEAFSEGWYKMIKWMQETQNLWSFDELTEKSILDYLSTSYSPSHWKRRAPLDKSLMPREN